MLDFPDHHHCQAFTRALREHLPRQSSWGRLRQYPARSFLWLDHEVTHQLCLLTAGRVEVLHFSPDGVETLLQVVQPGELFGELCFCPNRAHPHGVNARAAVASEVLEFHLAHPTGQHSLLRDPLFSAKLLEAFCRKLTTAEQRLRILALRDARARILAALRHFSETRGCAHSAPASVSFTLSHAELSAFTGLTRPHTTVILNRLRSAGLIHYQRGGVITLNPQQLPPN